jgi:hypothetical protein
MIRLRSRFIIFLFAFFFLLFFAGCSRTDEKIFLFEAELTASHRFPINDAFHSFELHIHNDYLILSQSLNPGFSQDYFFQAYRLSDFGYVGSFGYRGRGPGEWNNPDVVQSAITSPYLYLCDVSSRQKMTVIHKMELDSSARLIEIGTFTVDTDYNPMNRSVIRDDSLLVYEEYAPNRRALKVHHLKKDHPVITWEWMTSPPAKPSVEENDGILRANNSCIMFIYRVQDRIDIMDWDLTFKKRINYQKGKPVMPTDWRDNIKFYVRSFLGEHFLYAFYSDMYESERKAKNIVSLALEVFDMNGTPVHRYTFCEPTPTTFAVDERTFNLYGYREGGGMEDSISVYHLSGLEEYMQKK